MILYIFAFISGLFTILAPCIWPLLPIILSSTTTGQKRKPLGITLGLMISFGFFTLTISYIVHFIPFDTNILRIFAAIVIGFLGLTLIIPKLNEVVEGSVSRLSGRFGSKKQNTGNGFGVGLITGVSLGVVWAPCAGPILATIAALAATQKVSFQLIIVTLFYVIGIGIPLFVFATAGTKLFTKSKVLNKYLGSIQRGFGIVMILTAFAILTNIDKTIEAKLLNFIPLYSNALTSIESNSAVKDGLNNLEGKTTPIVSNNKQASDFVGIDKWLNTDSNIHIKDLKGKVVLVDFWTYTCINCIRTIPHITSWYNTYKNDGFVVIGIHTPEFQFEHDTNNVQQAIKQYNISYPVGQDNEYKTWNNYNNQYWPAEYLIDAKGNIRKTDFGEGNYDQMEAAIKQLLHENGKDVTTSAPTLQDQTPNHALTPETYLGFQRGESIVADESLTPGASNFVSAIQLQVNQFSLQGNWNVNEEYITPTSGASLRLNFYSSKVFLVLHPRNAGETIGISLDGNPVPADKTGSDINNSQIVTDSDRLYNLIDLKGKYENHTLQLNFNSGNTDVYVFTFG